MSEFILDSQHAETKNAYMEESISCFYHAKK